MSKPENNTSGDAAKAKSAGNAVKSEPAKNSQCIVVGVLRRDFFLLTRGTEVECVDTAKQAVAEGRAAETFVLGVRHAFSESDHAFAGGEVDRGVKHETAMLAPLNPGQGEQEATGEGAKEGETLKGNIEAAAEETRTEPTEVGNTVENNQSTEGRAVDKT